MPSHYCGSAEEVLALDTFIKLTRASDSIGARLLQENTFGDLTPSQFAVLEALYHLGPLCQSDIGAKLLKSGGNITLVIDNLEKQGLVSRQRERDDRRFVTVSLTESGRERIAGILPGHVVAIVNELSVLTPEEQRSLGRLCRKLGKKDKGSNSDPTTSKS
jgi:MarR family transcriptional regulator, 2-MHQ and catechol-resistance regulon repressor